MGATVNRWWISPLPQPTGPFPTPSDSGATAVPTVTATVKETETFTPSPSVVEKTRTVTATATKQVTKTPKPSPRITKTEHRTHFVTPQPPQAESTERLDDWLEMPLPTPQASPVSSPPIVIQIPPMPLNERRVSDDDSGSILWTLTIAAVIVACVVVATLVGIVIRVMRGK